MTLDSFASPAPPSEPSSNPSGAPTPPQALNIDSGLWALQMMGALHNIAIDEAKLRHEHGASAFNTPTILLAAQSLGMSGQVITQDVLRLDKAPLPAIGQDITGQYFIVGRFLPAPPSNPLTPNGFISRW